MILIAAIAGLFGIAIGSFLNVVIYRVPIGKSVVYPASACPNCGSGIHSYDNVPLLSWLVLRGKCRSCSAPISARYPLVELGTGLLFFVVSLPLAAKLAAIQPTVNLIASGLILVAFLYLAAISVALAFIDLEHHRLPNSIVLPSYGVAAILLGAAGILGGDYQALIRAAIGMGAMALGYFLLAFLWKGGMGLGDVKLARGVLSRRHLRRHPHPASQEHQKVRHPVRSVDGVRRVGRNFVRRSDLERLPVALRSGHVITSKSNGGKKKWQKTSLGWI
jgi:leader peptidase (prepilin peptidase)/N-methyltransferase